jgi:hypothetical protein
MLYGQLRHFPRLTLRAPKTDTSATARSDAGSASIGSNTPPGEKLMRANLRQAVMLQRGKPAALCLTFSIKEG